jgi:glycosyltransferase involved in cell wall biosynthesis
MAAAARAADQHRSMSVDRPDDRPLHILHVCDHLGWEGSRMHGVKRLFAWMIPRFDASRFTVSLVSLRKRDLSEETLDALGIDITYLAKSKFDPRTWPALQRIVDEKRIDVLHLHGYGATTFGRLVAAWRHLPVVLHEHANLTSTPWYQKVADRLLEPFTDVAIAVSESTAAFVRDARLVRPERVRVVYLGAPLDEFSAPRPAGEVARTRASLGVQPGDVVIGTVTRLHDSKGNEYLIDAAARVLRERPQARFFLFGEGPLRPALEAQAAALGLGDRFVFGGFVKDVAAVLWAFDISAFPSLWEGTPLTVFEAMAARRPIVATDADGLVDVLTPDRDALIVPKRDAAALADRIVYLVDRPDERARLAAGAAAASAEYDITAFVRKMERLYVMLHRESRARRRRVAETLDLSFLARRARA